LLQFSFADLRLQPAFSQVYRVPKQSRKEVIMKFVVLFEDNLDVGADMRRKHMPAHIAFLDRNAHKVHAAGPLKTPDGQGAGGIWVVDADDAGEVDKLVKDDPFWPTGLRKSVRILIWNQVYAEGQRLIVV
jgi:uncharacterized protein